MAGMTLARTKKGVRFKGYAYADTLQSPEVEAARHFRRVVKARQMLEIDPDPEETSRRALIYQQPM